MYFTLEVDCFDDFNGSRIKIGQLEKGSKFHAIGYYYYHAHIITKVNHIKPLGRLRIQLRLKVEAFEELLF